MIDVETKVGESENRKEISNERLTLTSDHGIWKPETSPVMSHQRLLNAN